MIRRIDHNRDANPSGKSTDCINAQREGWPVTLVYARHDHFDEKRAMATTLERELRRILGAEVPKRAAAELVFRPSWQRRPKYSTGHRHLIRCRLGRINSDRLEQATVAPKSASHI